MPVAFSRSAQFASAAFLIVLGVDALLSLVFAPPPGVQQRFSFLATHGLFHAAVLFISAAGALVAFLLNRHRLPSVRVALVLGISYGLCTVLVGPGMLVLAGVAGAVAWLALGSLAFALGTALFAKPWQRPAI